MSANEAIGLDKPFPRDVMEAYLSGLADERQDAQREQVKGVRDGAKALLSSPDFADILSMQQSNPLFRRLMDQNRRLFTAKAMDVNQTLKRQKVVALSTLDPNQPYQSPTLHLQRPHGLSFEQLRTISRESIFIDLIINTRIAQLQRFFSPSQKVYQPGFKITFDNDDNKTDADLKRARLLQTYLLHSGMETSPRKRRALKRDTMRDFIAKHLRDSLTLDAAPIELIPTVDGEDIHGWIAVDGATIFLTDPKQGLDEGYGSDVPELNELLKRVHRVDPEEVIAVRSVNGMVDAHFSHDNLLYPLRNPRTNELAFGYGDPEPERIIKIITGFLSGYNYNQRGLSDNSVPPGVMVLYGDFEEDDINFLQNDWLSQISGTNNRHRLPVIVTKDKQEGGVDFVSTGQPFSEVAFAKWITLNVALACGMYLIDPSEIAFDSYSDRSSSPLSGTDAEEKLSNSKDKGLRSLIDHLDGVFGELIQEIDAEARIEHTGLDLSKEEFLQIQEKASTWGEFREHYDYSNDDMDEELLDAPLNQAVSSVYSQGKQMEQQQEMMKQQAQMGQQPGQEGEDGQPQEQEQGDQGDFTDHEGVAWQQQQQEEPQQEQMAKSLQVSLFDLERHLYG